MRTQDGRPLVIRRLGNPDHIVPVLLEALRDPDGGVSVCAAEELDLRVRSCNTTSTAPTRSLARLIACSVRMLQRKT